MSPRFTIPDKPHNPYSPYMPNEDKNYPNNDNINRSPIRRPSTYSPGYPKPDRDKYEPDPYRPSEIDHRNLSRDE